MATGRVWDGGPLPHPYPVNTILSPTPSNNRDPIGPPSGKPIILNILIYLIILEVLFGGGVLILPIWDFLIKLLLFKYVYIYIYIYIYTL